MPPDGDFVRYVEQLSLANERKPHLSSKALRDASGTSHGSEAIKSKDTALPLLSAALANSFSISSLVKPLRWLVFICIATQLLSNWLPGAGFLFIPLFLAWAVWWFFKFKDGAIQELVARLKAAAEFAAQQSQADKSGSVKSATKKYPK